MNSSTQSFSLVLPFRISLAPWAIVILATITFFAFSIPRAQAQQVFDQKLLSRVETKFGKAARLRLENLVELIVRDVPKGADDNEKMMRINAFFNQVPWIADIDHWEKEDYWATPVEKLVTWGGDCEDYSVAKYFALKELGVPEDKLRLTYVKAIKLRVAHMVLTYFSEPTAMPLVLDNIIPEIRPANTRKDLIPVYSFNGDGLWLAKARGTGKRVGDSKKLSLWQDLIKRMDNTDITEAPHKTLVEG